MEIYETDLQHVTSKKTTYTMSILHKPTGLKVEGKGDHEYQLRCKLMGDLRVKLLEHQDPDKP
jgi:hypothetical protein